MKFIGQDHIMRQLELLLPKLFDERGSANILLRGPSGWGKTKMAMQICNYLSGIDYQYSVGDKVSVKENVWVHLIDEVHKVKEPENLYPLMDSKKFVFVFTTNDVEVLVEALSNRCYDFIFEPYTIQQLRTMASDSLFIPFDDDCLDEIIESSGRNPRILLNSVVNRLNLYQQQTGDVIYNLPKLKEVLKTYLGIEDRLDMSCRRYLDALREVGGQAGLDTLSIMLHINKDSLRCNVEPILLQKGLIHITSKGRIIA